MDVRGDVSQRWLHLAEARYSPDRTAIRVGYESALSVLKRGENTKEVVIAADQAVNKADNLWLLPGGQLGTHLCV